MKLRQPLNYRLRLVTGTHIIKHTYDNAMEYVSFWSLVNNSTDLITTGNYCHIMFISNKELRKLCYMDVFRSDLIDEKKTYF